MTTIGEDPV